MGEGVSIPFGAPGGVVGSNNLVEIQYVMGIQRCLPGNILGSVSSVMMVLVFKVPVREFHPLLIL